jgi:hypothetical protein
VRAQERHERPSPGSPDLRGPGPGNARGFGLRLLRPAQIGMGIVGQAPPAWRDGSRPQDREPRAGPICGAVPSKRGLPTPCLPLRGRLRRHSGDCPAGDGPGWEDLLTLPLPPATKTAHCAEDIRQELDNNRPGHLGFVVRWVEHGLRLLQGPDINDVGSWGTPASLRHLQASTSSNWHDNGICNGGKVQAKTLKSMGAWWTPVQGDPGLPAHGPRMFRGKRGFPGRLRPVSRAGACPADTPEPSSRTGRQREAKRGVRPGPSGIREERRPAAAASTIPEQPPLHPVRGLPGTENKRAGSLPPFSLSDDGRGQFFTARTRAL